MKFSSCSVVLLAVAIIVGAIPGRVAANSLSNASFESILEYGDPDLPNWFAFFGAGSTGTFSTVDPNYMGMIMASEGTHHLSITNDGAPDGFSGVLQRVPVTAGLDYTFSFDAKSNSGASFPLGAEFRIEWLNAAGEPNGATPNMPIAGMLTESYQNFSLTATAPAGTARGVPVIAVETFSANGTAGNLFVDNTSLTAIPEPGTVALAGLGIVVMLSGRRRR